MLKSENLAKSYGLTLGIESQLLFPNTVIRAQKVEAIPEESPQASSLPFPKCGDAKGAAHEIDVSAVGPLFSFRGAIFSTIGRCANGLCSALAGRHVGHYGPARLIR